MTAPKWTVDGFEHCLYLGGQPGTDYTGVAYANRYSLTVRSTHAGSWYWHVIDQSLRAGLGKNIANGNEKTWIKARKAAMLAYQTKIVLPQADPASDQARALALAAENGLFQIANWYKTRRHLAHADATRLQGAYPAICNPFTYGYTEQGHNNWQARGVVSPLGWETLPFCKHCIVALDKIIATKEA